MEKKLNMIRSLAHELRNEHGLSDDEIIRHIKKDVEIPLSVFCRELSSLEAIVKYMREGLGLENVKIAGLLHRSSKTIWATYKNANIKMNGKLNANPSSRFVPISVFKPRLLSVLESLVEFLKENYGMSNHEIAVILGRDDRTIWTVHKRAAEKRKLR